MRGQQYYLDTIFRIQPCCKKTKLTVEAENEEESRRIPAFVGEGLEIKAFLKFDFLKFLFIKS